MQNETNITIHNKLVTEKRDMNVYHHSTRSSHMISYNRSVNLSLKPALQDDYIHISIVPGPGRLEGACVVYLPSWINFELSSATDITCDRFEEQTRLKIPPGLPGWRLKLTRSAASPIATLLPTVTIGDDLLEHA